MQKSEYGGVYDIINIIGSGKGKGGETEVERGEERGKEKEIITAVN